LPTATIAASSCDVAARPTQSPGNGLTVQVVGEGEGDDDIEGEGDAVSAGAVVVDESEAEGVGVRAAPAVVGARPHPVTTSAIAPTTTSRCHVIARHITQRRTH